MIQIKLTHVLFIHLRIHVLKTHYFLLFVYLLFNYIILTLRNVGYQFNINYLNNIITLR